MKTPISLKWIINVVSNLILCTSFLNVSASEMLFESLQNDMEKFEKIATETRQNVDYMPYVISTLSGTELKQLGIINLREALELLPGVDLAVGMAGVRNPIFRGSNPFAYGQSKLIIDGSVVNDQLFGGYNQYLDLPVNLIHRIEVVRGPGSLLSHINGYSGSIHVVTKINRDDLENTDNEVFASVGSDDYAKAGFVVSKNYGAGDINLDFVGQAHNDESELLTDRFNQTGTADQELKHYNLGFSIHHDALDVKGRLNRNDSGTSYGQAFSLSDDKTDYLNIDNNLLDINYRIDIADDITANLLLGYLDETRTLKNKVIPDGFTMGMKTFPDGRYFLVDYKEETLREGLEFKIDRFKNHKMTFGFLWEQSKVKENLGKTSDDNLASTSTFPLLLTSERDRFSIYFDDLWDISEKVALQYGLKYDDYDDVDSELSPRLALVYRLDDVNIFKLMFTESYREPSWREQYLKADAFYKANLNLVSENVRAYEAAYIRLLENNAKFKINTFLLENQSQIHAQNNPAFENNEDENLWGVEMEYLTLLGSSGKFNVNYSYVDGANVDGQLANSTQHMLKAYLLYEISESLSASGIFKYIGDKGRIPGDSRSDVGDYQTVDIAANYEFPQHDIDLSLSIKNLFDTKYYFPSPAGTYERDFEQNGRQFFLSIGVGF
jgi:outer membrane receptor for ferrienterochelin and colicin